MIVSHGLQYNDLVAIPTFEQAVEEAKSGRVAPSSSTDWKIQARIICLSMMYKWQPILTGGGRTPAKEAALLEAIKVLLMTGEHGDLSLSAITNQCIEELQEDRDFPHCSKQIQYLRHAVCYLAYGMNMGNNQLPHVAAFQGKFLRCIPPTDVTCLHCQTLYPYERFSGDRIHDSRLIIYSNGTRWLCSSCRHSHYLFSRFQGEFILEESAVFPSFLDEGDCVSLRYAQTNFYWEEDEDDASVGEWVRERPDTSNLLNYSANPFNYNEWDERNAQNALVFGVELEMEPISQHEAGQQELIRLLGGSFKRGSGYILKSDGSLSYGVELVTMPFTVEQHKEEKALKWNKLLSAVNRGKARSGRLTEACGMHIHINKAALSALTIGKMLVFLNSETLSPLISTIAQRGSGHFCSRDGAKKVTDGIKRSESRYDIMNVSRSHPTCEIRMFRGNLRPERVYKNLEFCHALVQYCRQTSLQDLQDWGNFSRWLVSKRGHYPYLVQFLVDKQAVGFRQLIKEANEHYSAVAIQEV